MKNKEIKLVVDMASSTSPLLACSDEPVLVTFRLPGFLTRLYAEIFDPLMAAEILYEEEVQITQTIAPRLQIPVPVLDRQRVLSDVLTRAFGNSRFVFWVVGVAWLSKVLVDVFQGPGDVLDPRFSWRWAGVSLALMMWCGNYNQKSNRILQLLHGARPDLKPK